ncbi:MAG: (2Fe-2S)-binding protein [Conexibacter sp.]|nr:(2Fe-2S)-binding protein [Conexibacter sp.]
MNEQIDITVTVNGEPVEQRVEARMHAADFLRQTLGLTGTHVGCEQGVCGMCTILVDGQAVKGCLMLAPQLDGCAVETVESLAVDDRLDPLQQAFKDEHALQCGFCTPGFLMTATALARTGRRLSRAEIREELAGVLCRCTGYDHIVDAVERHLQANAEARADG